MVNDDATDDSSKASSLFVEKGNGNDKENRRHNDSFLNSLNRRVRSDVIDIAAKQIINELDKYLSKEELTRYSNEEITTKKRHIINDENKKNQLDDDVAVAEKEKKHYVFPFYDTIYNAILWQRDNYFHGSNFANDRMVQHNNNASMDDVPIITTNKDFDFRNNVLSSYYSSLPSFSSDLSSSSLGMIQICKLGSNFIANSPTVYNTIQPLIINKVIPSLENPIRVTLINSIPLVQTQLNDIMKYSVLNFLNNPQNREMIKYHTQGYIFHKKKKKKDKIKQ